MPNLSAIPTLLSMLAGHGGTATINNFYSSRRLLANVDEYFSALIAHPFSGDLLVGEAPGYAGCALTGIPFTSEYVLTSSSHPFIRRMRPRIRVSGAQKERSATMVWDRLTSSSLLPALWNAFPFHPHLARSHLNRRPTAAELAFGVTVLAVVIQILTPHRVFAIGRTAERVLKRHFPRLRAPYVRHPSNGGRSAFSSALAAHGVA